MSDYQAAFNLPLQISDNRNKRTEKSPSHKISIQFTYESAIETANYLLKKAENIKTENTTCSLLNPETSLYENQPGFTLWGNLWNKKGFLSPPVITTATDQPTSSQDFPF